MVTESNSESKYPLLQSLGVPGLRQYYGRVFEELLPELQQEKGRLVYRQMADQSAILGAVLFAIEMLARGVDWYTAPNAKDKDGKVAFFIETARHDMDSTWNDFIASCLSFLVYGWSLHEIEYKRRLGWQPPPDPTDPMAPYTPSSKFDDGMLGWQDFDIRGQDSLWRWEFGPHGEILGMWQLPPPDYVMRFIPYMKALLFRTSIRKNSPEGKSIFRNAHFDFYSERRIEIAEGIGIERDLAGYPVGLVPGALLGPSPSADDAASLSALQNSIRNIRRDEQEGTLWPSDRDDKGNLLYELKLLASPGKRQFDTGQIVARHDMKMAMVVLADFILMGHDQTGSKSMLSTRTELFADALTAWLDMIASVINTKAIPDLLRYNGISLDLAPTIQHTNITNISLQDLGTFIVSLAQSGFPVGQMKSVLKYALEEANMPNEEVDELDMTPQQPQGQYAPGQQSQAAQKNQAGQPQAKQKPAANPNSKAVTKQEVEG